MRVAGLAIDADFEYYQASGSTVAGTQNRVAAVMNAVNLVYERDVAITHAITTIVVRSSANDPYSASLAGSRLTQLRDEWNANFQTVDRDTVHLFTGQDLDGDVVGVAYSAVVCNRSSGYGLSQDRGTSTDMVGLVCHELGHNWSARHCNEPPAQSPCTIMCSSLNLCDGLGAPNFDPFTIGTISGFADTRPCLSLQPRGIWVDFAYSGTERGTQSQPFNTLAEGISAAPCGFNVVLVGNRSSPQTGVFQRPAGCPVTLNAVNGPVTIGR
ncbi:MAG: M12 family metallo-peptidase [Phycisphaerales bacterium]